MAPASQLRFFGFGRRPSESRRGKCGAGRRPLVSSNVASFISISGFALAAREISPCRLRMRSPNTAVM
jgi:hypothetical protein